MIKNTVRSMLIGILVFFGSVAISLSVDSPIPGLIGAIAFCLISIYGMRKDLKILELMETFG